MLFTLGLSLRAEPASLKKRDISTIIQLLALFQLHTLLHNDSSEGRRNRSKFAYYMELEYSNCQRGITKPLLTSATALLRRRGRLTFQWNLLFGERPIAVGTGCEVRVVLERVGKNLLRNIDQL